MQNLDSIIEQAIRHHESEVKLLAHITNIDVYMAVRTVMRNNPDIFWFSHQWEYRAEDNKVLFHYALGKQRCENAKIQIDDVVKKDFGIENVNKLSLVEQVMYVYKWIGLYCRYNIHAAHNQTIYSVFVYRNSVCTGIAKAAQYLFLLLGIESKLVFGRMNNSDVDSRHCWLIVRINGKWYHFDPTFAIPATDNLLYETGVEPITGKNRLHYNFFCTDTTTIRQSRTIEDEATLPNCNNIIDYAQYQDLEVFTSRNGHQGGLGCVLADTGSTADIYLVHDVKEPHGILSVAKVFREDPNHELLSKELRIMQECAGEPHILRVTNADFDKGLLYVEQATALSELLASHYYKLPLNGFCHLLLDIIAGLKELWRHGIVYRDIHLKNIYLSDTVENGRNIYKLGDFGSCTFATDVEKSTCFTDKGGVGSKWYMVPETLKSGVFEERSAVYSVGIVAYHLLNDLYPPLWQMYGEESLHLRINGMPLPIPCKLERPDCKHIDMTFLRKAICYEPSERYNSLDSFETAIEECIKVNQRYLSVVIVKGADSQDKQLGQQEVGFCSTCTDFDFPFIEVSNDESDNILYGENLCGSANILNDANADCCQDSAPVFSDDYSQRIEDFACTCRFPFDKRETLVSFIPQNHLCKGEAGKEMRKAAKHSMGLFSWLRGKRHRIESNNQPQLSSVTSSVFAPSEAKRGDYMMVQVFLYQDGEENAVLRKAMEVDSTAQRRNYAPLNVMLKHGDVVKVMLSATGTGVEIEEPIQELTWEGHYTDCQFCMFVSDVFTASNLVSTVTLSVNGVPAGRMIFKTTIVNQPRIVYAEIHSKTFNKIFISYSHKDEQRVRYIAEAYRAQGVDYFFDRHYLKAGDVYPVKIREYIESADLFILCWSKNAAESDYVTLERQQALTLAYPQVDMDKASLTIHPISIEPRAEYPEDMNAVYNFEDV